MGSFSITIGVSGTIAVRSYTPTVQCLASHGTAGPSAVGSPTISLGGFTTSHGAAGPSAVGSHI